MSFNGIDSELFAAALNGWFFNDRAVKLTADGIRGAINELVNIVHIVGWHQKYGGTLMARENCIDTDDQEDARNKNCIWLWDISGLDKRAAVSNSRNRLNLLLSALQPSILIFARVRPQSGPKARRRRLASSTS